MLHECLERVPEDIDAMRGLLEYGLQGTDLEALIAIGKGEDGGRWVLVLLQSTASCITSVVHCNIVSVECSGIVVRVLDSQLRASGFKSCYLLT